MKKIKKFFLTMAMTMIFSVSAFAASGFEFILNVPFGINVGIPNKETKDAAKAAGGNMDNHMGFDVGVDAQIGYMFQVKDGFGISVLGELGYSFDTYGCGYGYTIPTGTGDTRIRVSYGQQYHSFKIGLLPKFNIGFGGRHGLAIGIGGGAKIPISGKSVIISESGNTEVGRIDTKLKRKDITDMFSPSVIGYIKASIDYYLFFTDNIAMEFGLYLGGDFAPKQKETKIGCNSFDIGLQLGFRFGPKA